MGPPRRRPAVLALLAIVPAAALPGCYVVRTVVPTDASGMELPARWFADSFHDQHERTADLLSGFDESLARHLDTCRSNLTEDPRGF